KISRGCLNSISNSEFSIYFFRLCNRTQLLIYYLMGVHSIHSEFKQIENLGIFNPRLNKVYLLPISTISNEIINEVNTTVIGY
ncbi:hypothetical protein CN271_31405, partial [Bacillus cereus]